MQLNHIVGFVHDGSNSGALVMSYLKLAMLH